MCSTSAAPPHVCILALVGRLKLCTAAERGGDEMLHRPRHGTPAFMAPEMTSSHRRYR